MVGPECDEKIPDENELHLAAGFVRLGIIPDLGWAVGQLMEKADQFPLPGFGQRDEKRGGFGRKNRFLWVPVSHDRGRWRVWKDGFSRPRPFPS